MRRFCISWSGTSRRAKGLAKRASDERKSQAHAKTQRRKNACSFQPGHLARFDSDHQDHGLHRRAAGRRGVDLALGARTRGVPAHPRGRAVVILPAALIALPWYIRDIAVYGWPDFLGLIRHDQIVVGQMRVAEFITQQGWTAYGQRALLETFRSFWGQFGWMGVVMDSRIYFTLAILSGVALGGLIWRTRAKTSITSSLGCAPGFRNSDRGHLRLVQHAVPPAPGPLSVHGADPAGDLLQPRLGGRSRGRVPVTSWLRRL